MGRAVPSNGDPSQEIVWERAVEVFGSEELARQWMRTPLPILQQCTPEQYSQSGKEDKQGEVLTILA